MKLKGKALMGKMCVRGEMISEYFIVAQVSWLFRIMVKIYLMSIPKYEVLIIKIEWHNKKNPNSNNQLILSADGENVAS
jgi:hypothetical protein